MLAATASGWFGSLDEAAAAMRGPLTRFEPRMSQSVRDARIARWEEALRKV
jgi:glycerol kinase